MNRNLQTLVMILAFCSAVAVGAAPNAWVFIGGVLMLFIFLGLFLDLQHREAERQRSESEFSRFLTRFVDDFAEGKLCPAAQDTAHAVAERALAELVGRIQRAGQDAMRARDGHLGYASPEVVKYDEGLVAAFAMAIEFADEIGVGKDLDRTLAKIFREQLLLRRFQLFPVEWLRLSDAQEWMGVTENEAEQTLNDMKERGIVHVDADGRWALNARPRLEAIETPVLSPLWLGETPSPEVIRNQVIGYMKGKACAARDEEANAPTRDARSKLNKRATMFELAAEALEGEHG